MEWESRINRVAGDLNVIPSLNYVSAAGRVEDEEL
jgi:hypothetical protein